MPKSRDVLSRHVVFPPDNPTGECNEWCAPLHQFQERIARHPMAAFFDIDDFMLMGGWRRPGRPLLILSKHSYTRRYLNVDTAGDVWKYVEPREYSDEKPGMYRRLKTAEAALERIDLHQMPWMDRERFGHLREPDPWLDEGTSGDEIRESGDC